LLVALAACATSYPHVVTQPTEGPPALDAVAPAIVFGPVEHAAASWNEPFDAVTSHESDAVFSALYEFARDKGDPERDARLDVAAAELSAIAAKGAPLDDELVAFALRQHGVPDTAVLALAAKATEPDAIAAELTPQLGDRLFVGNAHVGVGGMSPMVVIVTHTALVTVAPTPRFLPSHGETSIAATLDTSFHTPRASVVHDDGSREQLAGTGPWQFRCGAHVGAQWVVFEADDDKHVATRLLAFPIECATRSPDTYRIEPRANADAVDAETRLASLVNRERVAGKLAPLAADRRAAAAARTQVTLMLGSASIAHDLGSTVASRLRDAGLVPPIAHEITLHAADLASVSELLMNEPAYRSVVMMADITHVGVAIARDTNGELYVAVELVSIVPPIDTAKLRTAVLARLRAHLPFKATIPSRKVLDDVAQKYARLYAEGWPDTDMVQLVRDDAQFMYSGYGPIRRALTLLLSDSPDKVDLGPPQPWEYDGVGLGIAQAPRDGALAGRVWVVLLFGKGGPITRH
jgi:uncharacterized protein YkwD